MTLLKHHHVSLHRHVRASFANAFATATIVSLVFCALLPFASTAMGYPEMGPGVLAKAFVNSWIPTFIFGLALSAVVFSVVRAVLNRFGANVGIIYVATGAILVANVMAFGAVGKDGLADNIGIWLGAGIGSAYGIFYWLVASRGRKQPVHPQQFVAMAAKDSGNL